MQMTILVGLLIVLTMGSSVNATLAATSPAEGGPVLPVWVAVGAYLLGSALLSYLATAIPMRAMRRASHWPLPGAAEGPVAYETDVPLSAMRASRLLGLLQQFWMAGGLAAAIWAGYGWWVWDDLSLGAYPLAWFLAGAAPLLLAAGVHWLLEYPLQREVRLRHIRRQAESAKPRSGAPQAFAQPLATARSSEDRLVADKPLGRAEQSEARGEAGAAGEPPPRQPWTRKSYLLYCLRQDLFMMPLPLVLVLTLKDCIDLYLEPGLARLSPPLPPDWSAGPYGQGVLAAATIAGSLAVLCLAPWLIVRAWGTRRFPDGPLRDTLLGVLSRTGVRFRQMLIWPTGLNVANAAVLGVIRPFRYALLSDALVRYMEPRDVEAVFHHEVRHVQAHHLFYLMMFVLSAGTLCSVAASGLAWAAGQALGLAGATTDKAGEGLALALMVGAIVGPFGWVSRRFERQCDTFAAWMMGREEEATGSRQQGIGLRQEGSPRQTGNTKQEIGNGQQETGRRKAEPFPVAGCLLPDKRVTPEGSAAFCWALQRLVQINCSSLGRRNWRHGSIAWRLQYLMHLSASGGSVDQIDRIVGRIKLGIWAATVLAAGLAVVVAVWP